MNAPGAGGAGPPGRHWSTPSGCVCNPSRYQPQHYPDSAVVVRLTYPDHSVGGVPLTTIEIQENITLLETALARGEKDVTYRDRRVTYNSAADLMERLRYFKGLLADTVGGRPRQTLLTAEKGL